MLTNDEIRSFLVEEYGEEKGQSIVLLPYYAAAFCGMSTTGRAIYNFSAMSVLYATQKHVSVDEADKAVMQDIEDTVYPLGENGPIVNLGNPFQ